jgi:anti-sigma-K factor RskA
MEAHDIHELAAGYVLDALDSGERREFESHLTGCTICAEELPSLRAAAGALAYAVDTSPAPSSGLRAEILERAVPERHTPATVVPLRRRAALPIVSAVTAAAVAAGIVVGLWASSSAGPSRPLVVPIEGRQGSLVVTDGGGAFLVVPRLRSAPPGKTYEAWVVLDGIARPAGTFQGGKERVVVSLDRPVPSGARVAVSLEPAGGSQQPTGPVLLQTESA